MGDSIPLETDTISTRSTFGKEIEERMGELLMNKEKLELKVEERKNSVKTRARMKLKYLNRN